MIKEICIITSFAALAYSYADSKKMNVIYIMSDDHTSQAVGAYGSRLFRLNPTPVIDGLAKDGMLFSNCFVTNSICTPSRACIITGQYSHHNGVLTLEDTLDENKEYLPQEFKKIGYDTAVIGKWHLKSEPSSFDYYCVLTGAGGQGFYFNPQFQSNYLSNKKWPDNIIKTKGYSTDVITNISIQWLKNGRDKTKPFFLLHQYKAPHYKFEYAPRYEQYLDDVEIPVPSSLFDTKDWGSVGTRGKNDELRRRIGSSVSPRHLVMNYVDYDFKIDEKDPHKATYLAYQVFMKSYLRCVKGIDDNLKRLFDYLKSANLWDNTIIVYTGDQGMMLGEHDLVDKRWMYEESQRMPFIIRDPRSTQKGQISDLMINNIDFAPTLLELAGRKNTPEYMDGKSFAGVLFGNPPKAWKDAVYYRYWMHLIHHDIPAHFGIRTKDYKLIFFYGRHYDPKRYGEKSMWGFKNSFKIEPTPVSFELYDLKNDPYEMKNVAEDPAYAQVLSEMKSKLKSLKESVNDDDSKYPEIQEVIDEAFKGVK